MKWYADLPTIFLHPGDCFLAVQPVVVSTVLGSCVAVALTCAERGVGAICHAVMPSMEEMRQVRPNEPQACRYVDQALEHMLSGMRKLKIPPEQLEAKVFGGARVLNVVAPVRITDVGARNHARAVELLEDHGIRIGALDVGGTLGRKIHYVPHTGEIWRRFVSSLGASAAQAQLLADGPMKRRRQ